MTTKRDLRKRWREEPGASIRQRFIDINLRLEKGHGHSSAELFALLDGLPFRDEVIKGRDLRGSDFVRGMELDFSNTDFSFSTHVGSFFHCDLTGARFDESLSEGSSFHQRLDGASFRKIKFRKCYFNEASARNCCFDGARLPSGYFDRTDLSGSSFVGADCNGACFVGANLIGCDFRGAKLDDAQFQDALIDKTTDFRGASLVNAAYKDRYNNSGRLIRRGIDLHAANFDDTTRFGEDPVAQSLAELTMVAKVAERPEYGPDGAIIAATANRIKANLNADRRNSWLDDLLGELNDRQKQLYEEIQDEAFRTML